MPDSLTSAAFRAPADGPTAWEKVFVLIVFMYSSGAFLQLILGFNYDPGAGMGTLSLDIAWAVIFGVAFYLLFRRAGPVYLGIKNNRIFLLLVGMPFASVLWSDHPWITLLASGALTGTVVISLYISQRFTSGQLIASLGWTLALCGFCSLIFVIFLPRYGIGTGDFAGQWQGIYSQKNELGRMMALGFLIYLLRFKFSQPRQFRYLFLAAFMLTLVCLAQSATALAVCLSVPAVLWLIKTIVAPSRHPIRRILIALCLPLALLLVSVNYFEQIANAFGRDEGLTGRATLWALVAGAIQEQPLFGYGYEGFWRGGGNQADEIWKEFGQFLYFSHNGILEIWLALGLLGVIVVVGSFCLLSWRALRLIRWRCSLTTVWPLLFLWYLFVVNLTDDYLLAFHRLQTILFFVVVLGMPRDGEAAATPTLPERLWRRRLLPPIVSSWSRWERGWGATATSAQGARE